jgi:hypothetical protein
MTGYQPADLAAVWSKMRNPPRMGVPKDLPTGVDGMRTEHFEKNLSLQLHEISRRIGRMEEDNVTSYHFSTLLCFEQPKNSSGFRKIHVPRLRDQVVLRAMHDDLVQAAKINGLCLCPPNPKTLVNSFRQALESYSEPWILRTDIQSFFDSVPRDRVIHEAMNLRISHETRGLLSKWSSTLRSRSTGKLQGYRDLPVVGLPQGLSLSSSLAELWAIKIDQAATNKLLYFRYIDDIVVICESRHAAEESLEFLKIVVSNLGLCLSNTKTQISSIKDGVSWLGLEHFKEKIFIEKNRLDRWLRRFHVIRRRAAEKLRVCISESEKEIALKIFHREIRDEITGRTSSRPSWYMNCEDTGEWKMMDQIIHSMIRSLHRQAGADPPQGRQLPSIHRTLHAMKSRIQLSAPSNADQGPCALFSSEENQSPIKGYST